MHRLVSSIATSSYTGSYTFRSTFNGKQSSSKRFQLINSRHQHADGLSISSTVLPIFSTLKSHSTSSTTALSNVRTRIGIRGCIQVGRADTYIVFSKPDAFDQDLHYLLSKNNKIRTFFTPTLTMLVTLIFTEVATFFQDQASGWKDGSLWTHTPCPRYCRSMPTQWHFWIPTVCDDLEMLSMHAAHASHARQRRMHRRKGCVF